MRKAVTDFGWRAIWFGAAWKSMVMQPSSLPVDRRARRAKTDVIDVEMLFAHVDGVAPG